MKPSTSKLILAGTLMAAGLQLAVLTGCVGGVGYADDDGGYYGGDPAFYGGVYVNGGGGWYRGHRDGAYAHPAFHPSPAGHAAAPHEAPHASGGGGGGDHHR